MTPYGDMSELARGSEEWLTGFMKGAALFHELAAEADNISDTERLQHWRRDADYMNKARKVG